MLAAALIVFREVLEAALIVAIIMAATRTIRHRSIWIASGIAGGLFCAGMIAALTNAIASSFDGAGQEIVNAGILFAAVALISWHVLWMSTHGREMATQMKSVGQKVSDGTQHMSVLAFVVGLAVMREGAEIVLMLQGLWVSDHASLSMLAGCLVGFIGGILLGGAIYVGFLVLPIQRVFTMTNGFLILIAAGMAARAGNFLAQAGLVPSLGANIWNTSWLLSDQSVLGQFLSALIGYIARPSGIEILLYGLTLVLMTCSLVATHRRMTFTK